jgi:hypothetical protein
MKRIIFKQEMNFTFGKRWIISRKEKKWKFPFRSHREKLFARQELFSNNELRKCLFAHVCFCARQTEMMKDFFFCSFYLAWRYKLIKKKQQSEKKRFKNQPSGPSRVMRAIQKDFVLKESSELLNQKPWQTV